MPKFRSVIGTMKVERHSIFYPGDLFYLRNYSQVRSPFWRNISLIKQCQNKWKKFTAFSIITWFCRICFPFNFREKKTFEDIYKTRLQQSSCDECLMVWHTHSHIVIPGDFHSLKGRLKKASEPRKWHSHE